MLQKALVVVDVQNDFIFGILGSEQAREALTHIRNKIETRRNEGYRIIFTRDTHDTDYLETQEGKKLPLIHCVRGTDGWQIVDGLFQDTDVIVDKNTFGSIEVADYQLSDLDTEAGEVELVGVCTDICVVANAVLLKTAFPEAVVKVDPAV